MANMSNQEQFQQGNGEIPRSKKQLEFHQHPYSINEAIIWIMNELQIPICTISAI